MTDGARLAAHRSLARALSALSDRELGERVAAARALGRGIGGKASLLDVGGVPVFVKRVPLTDLERRGANVGSTANLFGLPASCQYGIGGPGFGVWRELAVHGMASDWVSGGEFAGFPLLHHWRVLPDETPLHEELADVDGVVAFWGGGSGVRRRVEELGRASASVALFLEYVPRNLHEWLGEQVAAGGTVAGRACAAVERGLADGVAFMNGRGLLHFDVHFENVLTDGRRLYFADFGLALSDRFVLSPEEAGFFARHRGYDRCYAASYLVNWLVTAFYGYGREEREAYVRECAGGARPEGVPEEAAAIIVRYAPLAVVMNGFLGRLRRESRDTPYPERELARFVAL
ncbi:protein kinase family protein [Streptomyces sp. SID14478]|uniref:protein kinase family protein n=1 Tax=Streptomyces sp. SID14478 TaxID=2706073 RepID=UPI0013DEFF1C|nr:protein kinase family protein [Streptomyces sp. SID14478]NEB81638.1 protein kinase family protein [Streptomyces sp. SID14478]